MISLEDFVNHVVNAKIYDLGQPYFNGMPVHPEDPPYSMVIYRYHEYTKKIFEKIAPGFSDSMELVITSMHSGTHIDSKCHMARNGTLHNGVKASEIVKHSGYTKYGTEEIPIFVKRAILFDVPASKGLDILPHRYEISAADLEKCLTMQNVELREGDAALIRTGYSRYFTTDKEKYLHDFAGITEESAKWLIDRKISLLGIDNLAMAVPKPFNVHLMFLVDAGIHVMKSLNLEELAKDKAYTSVLVVSPLKIVGGTGSLVRPFALVNQGKP
ncbi:MAG: cyclase family protein [Candidatus Caldarchaeum sp.]|nr:cyclase family protein [Candidatus Caldarchaeum sp.]MCX8200729.1 cyclase family protein [Candidatus Caldarchaeum sp.]MDW8062736.1 cyclase family protein [Candidatus Caldarchaeum sp.]MDW8434638.1 cyclase family protein [Candidatus Caldarchaeum sp.]